MVGKPRFCIVMIQGCVGAVTLETKLHNVNQVIPWRIQLVRRQAQVSQALLTSYIKTRAKNQQLPAQHLCRWGEKYDSLYNYHVMD